MESVDPADVVRFCCHSVCSMCLSWVLTYGELLSVRELGPYGRDSAHLDAPVTANKCDGISGPPVGALNIHKVK